MMEGQCRIIDVPCQQSKKHLPMDHNSYLQLIREYHHDDRVKDERNHALLLLLLNWTIIITIIVSCRETVRVDSILLLSRWVDSRK
jgi:hypothetical protein